MLSPIEWICCSKGGSDKRIFWEIIKIHLSAYIYWRKDAPKTFKWGVSVQSAKLNRTTQGSSLLDNVNNIPSKPSCATFPLETSIYTYVVFIVDWWIIIKNIYAVNVGVRTPWLSSLVSTALCMRALSFSARTPPVSLYEYYEYYYIPRKTTTADFWWTLMTINRFLLRLKVDGVVYVV